MLLHIVAIKFVDGLDEERLKRHFVEEVNLKARMPDLVISWSWSKNLTIEERGPANRAMQYQYVMTVRLRDEAALEEFLPHAEHLAVKEIQASMVADIIPLDITIPDDLLSDDAPLLHVVPFKIKEDVSEESVEEFLVRDCRFTDRMPDLVKTWAWSKNLSLASRADKNHGMQYIIVCTFRDEAALAEYGPNAEHQKLKEMFAP